MFASLSIRRWAQVGEGSRMDEKAVHAMASDSMQRKTWVRIFGMHGRGSGYEDDGVAILQRGETDYRLRYGHPC